ncbi:FAD-dependent oxidoreductase [Actinopolymorpha singaporensis]|uniref:Glycine/D-amino acid oxidase n=1 Tax=Actinopolymorpha singaporensis TaxID=117157 RepID=A0A1H1MH17_9ACTN|nr:FAD-dependent oxidoreductase [Actinopolymorpha singaporensis]SDR85665.1 Glycine/D-amino acid oxidase [Actinopolymorpha singaporensis]
MTRHASVWFTGPEGPTYPALDTDLDVDVAVVGGGLVGLTTALLAQRAGLQTVVLEARRLTAGSSGHTTAKVTTQHGLIYAELAKRHGWTAAGQYAAANAAGMELVTDLVERSGIDCRLTRAPSYAYTLDEGRVGELEAEVAAATKVGIAAGMADTAEQPFNVAAAVRFDDQLHFHPVRYLRGVAAAAAEAGAGIHEDTRVTDVSEGRDRVVTVTTSSGVVRARHVVMATLLPLGMIGGYFARTRPQRSYGLAARLRGPAPTAMTLSVDQPTRSTRPWLDPGPNGIIVVGNGHETGASDVDTEEQVRDLVEWTRATFDVEDVEYTWSAQDFTTPDHIPYVGAAPGHHAILVATGFGKWGLSNGSAAAMMLVDAMSGRSNPWASAFDARRIGDVRGVVKTVTDNLHVGKEFVGGYLGTPESRTLDQVLPGTGGLIRVGGQAMGVYRDPAGNLHGVRPTCSHMGCRLHWNAAETSWDCNCHGSRFDPDGAVLTGPATSPLQPRDPQATVNAHQDQDAEDEGAEGQGSA